jgi:hypothetical protein
MFDPFRRAPPGGMSLSSGSGLGNAVFAASRGEVRLGKLLTIAWQFLPDFPAGNAHSSGRTPLLPFAISYSLTITLVENFVLLWSRGTVGRGQYIRRRSIYPRKGESLGAEGHSHRAAHWLNPISAFLTPDARWGDSSPALLWCPRRRVELKVLAKAKPSDVALWSGGCVARHWRTWSQYRDAPIEYQESTW